MRNFWIVIGSEENWKLALISKCTWGLEETKLKKVYWLAISPNDIILFYVTRPVRGIVGYGNVRSKFYQDIPVWDEEKKEGKVKWPLRFEFDIDFLLPENRWEDEKIPVRGGGEFRQPLIYKELEEIQPIIRELNPKVSEELLRQIFMPVKTQETEVVSPTHDFIKNLLMEIGKLQGYIADTEFNMETERLDAVWRRLPESVPTYVFEVQLGGDLYHALGKLKHAHDIWNSRIFLVASAEDLGAVNKLLSGTFHEIKPILRFIEIEKIQNLHQSKQNIYHIEKDLGLIP